MEAKNKQSFPIGGQALIEGVLMRGKLNATAVVRTESGKLVEKGWKFKPASGILKFPFVRGVGVLYESLVLGFKALAFSANAAGGKNEKGTDVMGKKEMAISFVFAIGFALVLFVIGPLLLTKLVVKTDGLLFNVVDGVFRLLAFLAYLALISLFKDVQRIFQYHGAEHMTIHAYEHGEKLIPVKIRKYPTMHPRCGTSFLLIVILLSVLVFSIVSPDNIFLKILSRIILLPVIAGISYELLRLGAKFERNPLMKVLVWPGLLLQLITTKEPDEKQILVAVAAIKSVIRKN